MVFIQRSLKFTFSLCLLFLLSACLPPNSQEVAPGTIRKAFSPTWGPDGQRIAFLYRYRPEGSQEVFDSIYSVLLNGTDLIKIRSLSPARFKDLTWSPDGSFLLLTTEETEEIFITENNGLNLEKLGEGEQVTWHPFELKFVSSYDNTCETMDRVGGKQCQRQIRLYDLPSRTHLALPIALPRQVIAPTWSADGLKLNWLSTITEPDKEQAQRLLELHTYNLADSTHQITLVEPTELVFSNAKWSQDRNILAFNYLSQIYLYFFKDKAFFSITQGIEPRLSSNNNRILYTNLIGENRGDIALFDRSDQSIRTIISHRNLPESAN